MVVLPCDAVLPSPFTMTLHSPLDHLIRMLSSLRYLLLHFPPCCHTPLSLQSQRNYTNTQQVRQDGSSILWTNFLCMCTYDGTMASLKRSNSTSIRPSSHEFLQEMCTTDHSWNRLAHYQCSQGDSSPPGKEEAHPLWCTCFKAQSVWARKNLTAASDRTDTSFAKKYETLTGKKMPVNHGIPSKFLQEHKVIDIKC